MQACCHASLAGLGGRAAGGAAAEGADQAEKAMADLRHAVKMGFRTANAYRTESSLDPVRNRPDFRELIMDVMFPVDPFAISLRSAVRQFPYRAIPHMPWPRTGQPSTSSPMPVGVALGSTCLPSAREYPARSYR